MSIQLRHFASALLCTLPFALGLGCAPAVPPGIIEISIAPGQASVAAGKTASFIASVTGTDNTAVTWSVQESGGGTISDSGDYTAPNAAGSYHVVATSAADPTRSATATVVVTSSQPPAVMITIAPATAALAVNGTQAFTAVVTGSSNTNVLWSVQESAGGAIAGNGTYTAPATAGTYHVVATAAADSAKTATATVTVTAAPPAISVSVSPASAAVAAGGTQAFTATVTGSGNQAVTWSVTEAAGGAVTAAGVYTAPTAAGTYHVVATSAADVTKSATASVTVTSTPPGVTVTVAPATVSLASGATQAFTATVTGTANTSVNWSITEAAGGTITSAGVYTAPAAAGGYHVVATSAADATKSATASVTVTNTPPGVTVTVAPATASLTTGGTQAFTATVTGATNTAVIWTVTESSGGTITSAGVYTAPAVAGTFHVVATSVAEGTKGATATVTVSSGAAASLAYTDPASGMYQLKRNATLSTATHLVLDLVGSGAPSGTAVAFTLTSDASFTSWSKVATADAELVQNGAVLTLGSGALALKAKVVGPTLQAVVGQKGLGAPVALNGVLARVALDLKAGAPKGTVALASPKAQVLTGATIGAATIAVGTLAAQ